MHPSDAADIISATVATLIDQSLPEIQAVVLSVLLEATTAPHGKLPRKQGTRSTTPHGFTHRSAR